MPRFFSCQFEERSVPVGEVRVGAPPSLFVEFGVVFHAVGDGEHVCDSVLRHALGAVCGDVGDDDAAVACRLCVDDVISGGEHSYVFQVLQFPDEFCVEYHLVGEYDIGLLASQIYLVFCRTVVDGDITQLP